MSSVNKSHRVDYDSLLFIKKHLEKNKKFTAVYLEPKESGKQYDLLAVGKTGQQYKIEVKTCRQAPIKDGVNFSNYFNTSAPYLWDNAAFKHNMGNFDRAVIKYDACQNYAGYWDYAGLFHEKELAPDIECIPSLQHKYAYMLSASTPAKGAMHPKTKFKSLVADDSNTIYLLAASDGYILWNKQDLINGAIAYVNVVCGASTDFRNKKRVIEYKAVIDLNAGLYVPWTQEEAKEFDKILHLPKK